MKATPLGMKPISQITVPLNASLVNIFVRYHHNIEYFVADIITFSIENRHFSEDFENNVVMFD